MFRLNARLRSCGEEPSDSLVPETLDRHATSVTCMVTGRNLARCFLHGRFSSSLGGFAPVARCNLEQR